MVTSILCRLIEKALAAASLNDEAASFDQRYSIGMCTVIFFEH